MQMHIPISCSVTQTQRGKGVPTASRRGSLSLGCQPTATPPPLVPTHTYTTVMLDQGVDAVPPISQNLAVPHGHPPAGTPQTLISTLPRRWPGATTPAHQPRLLLPWPGTEWQLVVSTHCQPCPFSEHLSPGELYLGTWHPSPRPSPHPASSSPVMDVSEERRRGTRVWG